MEWTKEAILTLLGTRGIEYECIAHGAIYNMAESAALHLPREELTAKNLFVRDGKKRRYYLLSLKNDKRADLKALGLKLEGKPLGMASPEDLNKILGLFPGAVTPFGLLNDKEKQVKLLLDSFFRDTLIGVHPNDNRATVWLPARELLSLLEEQGVEGEFYDFSYEE